MIAVAPTIDELVLVDAAHPEAAVRVLEQALERYRAAARQLSPVPYLVRDAGIEPWEPPDGHPARLVVDTTTRNLALIEYAHQKAALDERLAKAGEDLYIAQLRLMQRRDGSVRSAAMWTKQTPSGLLPRADMLGFFDMDHPGTQFVRWDDVLRIAGDALQEEAGYDPPLWRHRGWPDSDTVAVLRAHAVPASA